MINLREITRKGAFLCLLTITVVSGLGIKVTVERLQSAQIHISELTRDSDALRNTLARTVEDNEQLKSEISDLSSQLDVLRNTQEDYETLTEQHEELLAHISTKDSAWKSSKGIATAYSPYDDQNGIQSEGLCDRTSIGLTPGPGIIAVDPKRIPYGSTIIVICNGSIIEIGIAGDTGGALRNDPKMHVDIFRQTFQEALDFAVKDVTILWKENKTTNNK